MFKPTALFRTLAAKQGLRHARYLHSTRPMYFVSTKATLKSPIEGLSPRAVKAMEDAMSEYSASRGEVDFTKLGMKDMIRIAQDPEVREIGLRLKKVLDEEGVDFGSIMLEMGKIKAQGTEQPQNTEADGSKGTEQGKTGLVDALMSMLKGRS
ncbi:hypothetical protein GGI25_001900 [Coemansia spiralis]|uniref:Uncharacterized protein n=2 Tax=Coemansia TaxID=4863 RepID=A0A9W8GBM4_9FUNG|nr:hypothetical protein BX070DRAFT_246130 [Coemansia spiralis]KAJ1993333.1 hypothetical protein EDC05_002197 [Coemansia umbellata]KAJ2623518.1 hypothetical protein GGI26_002357 [Coemansia sp. RSA 1358]KAJ2678911.1 hypothetical protein GGI25_001900 [Coemansia spiralis]